MTSHCPLLLGEDLGAIAQQLESLAAHLRGQSAAPAENENREAEAQAHDPVHCVRLARQMYANRRRRKLVFSNPDIFGEPAWDILLDLYIAQADKRPISVSSACIGSAAPPTTGLRWLGVLQQDGLILREHDPQDQRRILVRLSPDGLSRMENYLRKIAQASNAELAQASCPFEGTGAAD